MTIPHDATQEVGWFDFESEPEMAGDGSGDPDKHYLTIVLNPGEDNEEIAVVVHRTCGGKYPIDGPLANRKRRVAKVIVDALNDSKSRAQGYWADDLVWTAEDNGVPEHLVDVLAAAQAAQDASLNASNDTEIDLLREALELALAKLDLTLPTAKEID